MKKSLIIAMCCITVLFAACKREKPYEKFIGNYKGSDLVEATVSVENPLIPGQTMVQELDPLSFAMEATIAAGDADNKLVMILKPENEEETFTLVGIIDKEQVTFETATINQTIDGYSIDMTANLTGTLVNNVLSVTGPFSGTGSTALLEIPVSVSGKMTMILNKQQ